eukprot:FR737536.1.p1 GENE.FR737536.1~~FR737536.1.p1  ORF type:complete len:187 (+),score=29.02 FR737536.1:59-562(+)
MQKMQRLQSTASKIDKYKSTIKTQERVIKKMEKLLDSKLSILPEYRLATPPLQDKVDENFRDEASQSISSNAPALGKSRSMPELSSDEMQRLRNEMEAKDARIKAVEFQLVKGAQTSAKQIAELKLKIFELEMGEDSGSLGGLGSLAESGGADGSVSESRFSFLDGE